MKIYTPNLKFKTQGLQWSFKRKQLTSGKLGLKYARNTQLHALIEEYPSEMSLALMFDGGQEHLCYKIVWASTIDVNWQKSTAVNVLRSVQLTDLLQQTANWPVQLIRLSNSNRL